MPSRSDRTRDVTRSSRGRARAGAVVGVLVAAVGALLNLTGLPGFVRELRQLDGMALAGVLAAVFALLMLVVVAAVWRSRSMDPPTDVPQSVGGGPRPAQLPPAIAHFTGRSGTLAELGRVFAEAAPGRRRRGEVQANPVVVSVHGPAGVGKSALITRFAHSIADRYPDGQLYVNLRGAGESRARTEAEEVLAGFLHALGARFPADPGDRQGLQNLWHTWVKDRRILIFLDNAHDAKLVQALIPSEPGCAVLVTSRQSLVLRNTRDLMLRRFSTAQGVELLKRLAGAERVAGDGDAAETIVELCDHLPLAISICGGRLGARDDWPLAEMARVLDDERRRLDELEVPNQTDEIDKSLRASLRLSYDGCAEPQQRLLRSFGLLAAPDIPSWVAGELLGVAELEGDKQLGALVDAQLVEYSSTGTAGTMRYRLHDLVRLYSVERAENEDAPQDRYAAIERVLGGYRDRAEKVAVARWPQDWAQRTGGQRGAASGSSAMNWLVSERLALIDLLDQAAELEQWQLVWELGRAACSLFHSLRVFWQEWREVAEITCAAAENLEEPHPRGVALLERAAAVGGHGQVDQARADAQQALHIFEELGERWWAARARRTVGMTLREAGNLDEGQTYLIEAIEDFDREGDEWWRARTQRNLGELRMAQRDHREARELFERALEVFKRNGNNYSEAQTLRAYGEVRAAEGRDLQDAGELTAADRRFKLAAATLVHAAERFRNRHEQWEQARCLRAAGEIGDPTNGLQELVRVREARDMLKELGDVWGVARTQLSEGQALARLGRHHEAVGVLKQTTEKFRDLRDRWWLARSLRTLAEVLLDAGQTADAREPAEKAVEIYRNLGNESGVRRAEAVLNRARGGR